jgi:hypothetical protein
MARNDIISAEAMQELLDLPRRAAMRAAKRIYRSTMTNQDIVQDSGQAAFNIMYAINEAPSKGFVVANDGSEPTVGKRGDQRGASGHKFVVARQKLADFEADMQAIKGKPLHSITIYSTLKPGGTYEQRARIAEAFVTASNPALVDVEVAEEIKSMRGWQ